MSDNDIRPTPEDLMRDLREDLEFLAGIKGDVVMCRAYHVGDHRSAIRRALAAEADRAKLRRLLRDLYEQWETGDRLRLTREEQQEIEAILGEGGVT